MTVKGKKSLLTYLPIVLLAVTGCNGSGDEKEGPTEAARDNVPQGVITYEISYPGISKTNNIIYSVLPKKMALTYKGNRYKTEVGMKSMRFNTTLISDNENHKLTTIFENGNKRNFAEMTKVEVNEFLKTFPEVDYLNSNIRDSLFGLETQRTTALFADISKEVPITFTEDIPMVDPNWCNPYSALPGMLLSYEIKYYGVQMAFKALSIDRDTTIEDAVFNIPEGFEQVAYTDIQTELLKLFEMVNPKELSEEDQAIFYALVTEGDELSAQGNAEEAIAKYEEAWNMHEDDDVLNKVKALRKSLEEGE